MAQIRIRLILGYTALIVAASKGYDIIVTELLNAGASWAAHINKDREEVGLAGATALAVARANNKITTVELLINAGAEY